MFEREHTRQEHHRVVRSTVEQNASVETIPICVDDESCFLFLRGSMSYAAIDLVHICQLVYQLMLMLKQVHDLIHYVRLLPFFQYHFL